MRTSKRWGFVTAFILLVLLTNTLLASNISPSAACSPRWRTMSGSYRLSPADPSSPRIYYEVKYYVNSNCSVTSVQDRTRGSVMPYGTEPMNWLKSCVKGSTSCQYRNATIPPSGAWTTWRGLPSSTVGSQYRNYTSYDYGSWVAYGYTYFGP